MGSLEIPNTVVSANMEEKNIRSFALDRAIGYYSSRSGQANADSIVKMADVFVDWLKGIK